MTAITNALISELGHGDRICSVSWNEAHSKALVVTAHGRMFTLHPDNTGPGRWYYMQHEIREGSWKS